MRLYHRCSRHMFLALCQERGGKKGEDKMEKRRMNGIKRILTAVFICVVLVNEPAGRKVYAVEGTPQETVAVSNKQEFYEAIGRQIREHKSLVYYDTYENAVGTDFQKAFDDYYFHHDAENLFNSGSYLGRYIEDGYMESWHGDFSDDHNCQIRVKLAYKYDKEILDEYWEEMKEVAASLKGESDYESVKAVHDYLINNYEYDENYKNYLDYEGYRDGTMVCQGYCMAAFLLLSEMDIPVRIVTGASQDYQADSNHAWNVVKVDGQWYNMDVTWDDKGGKRRPDYTFFLKSDADFYKHTRDGWYDYDKDMALVSYVKPNQPGLAPVFILIVVLIIIAAIFIVRRNREKTV